MAEVTPYVKQTWTDGSSSASAARFTVIEEGVRAAHEQPAARVFHNASQSITTGTQTALAFNSERYDQFGGAASTLHDTVTNNSRLTCRHAGVYQISGTVEWETNATARRELRIRLNGTTIICADNRTAISDAAATTNCTINTQYALAVNDYVELMVFQASGSARNVLVTANFSPEFMMARVA